MRSLTRIAGGLVLLALALAPRAAHAAVTGSIEGVVTDQATGKKLAGVTVTVTSPALQGEQTEFTDADGHYIITELPPGEYLVRFYFSEHPRRASRRLRAQADKTLSVNVAIPTQKAEVKTYRITEKAPTVDVGNTQMQTSVTSEFVRNTPVRGRTYDAHPARWRPAGAATGIGTPASRSTAPPAPRTTSSSTASTRPTRPSASSARSSRSSSSARPRSSPAATTPSTAAPPAASSTSSPSRARTSSTATCGSTPRRSSSTPRSSRARAKPSAHQRKTKYALRLRLRPRRSHRQGQGLVLRRLRADVHHLETDALRRAPRTANDIPDRLRPAPTPGDLDPSVELPGVARQDASAPAAAASRYAEPRRRSSPSTTDRQAPLQLDRQAQLPAQPEQQLGRCSTSAARSRPRGIGHRPPLNGTTSALLGSTLRQHARRPACTSCPSSPTAACSSTSSPATTTTDCRRRRRPPAGPRRVALRSHRAARDLRAGRRRPARPQTAVGRRHVQPVPGPQLRRRRLRLPAAHDGAAHLGLGRGDLLRAPRRHPRAQARLRLRRQHLQGHALATPAAPSTACDAGDHPRSTASTALEDARARPERRRHRPLRDGFTATTTTLQLRRLPARLVQRRLHPRPDDQRRRALGSAAGPATSTASRRSASTTTGRRASAPSTTSRARAAVEDLRQLRLVLRVDPARHQRPPVLRRRRLIAGSRPDRELRRQRRRRAASTPRNCTWHRASATPTSTAAASAPSSPALKGMYSEEVVAGVQYDVGLDMVLGACYIHRDLGRIIEDISPDGGNNYIIANPGDAVDSGAVNDLAEEDHEPARSGDLRRQPGPSCPRANAAAAARRSTRICRIGFAKPKRNYDALVLTATKRLSHNFLVLASYTYSRTHR